MSHHGEMLLLRRIAEVWGGPSTGIDANIMLREIVPFLRGQLENLRAPPPAGNGQCRLDYTLHDVLTMLIDSVEHRARVEKENVR